MIIISLGVLGFLSGIAFDLTTLKRLSPPKWIVSGASGALLGISHVVVALSPEKLSLPTWTAWLGWVLLVVGALLLFYSLFAEIPFSKTYVQTGPSNALMQEGTYALTRHPGVLWYALALAGLVLASQSRLALVAAPVWLLMDAVWVWVEDAFLFEQMFEGYREYKKRTPMLVPTWASTARCWQTLPLRQELHRRLMTRRKPGTD